MQINKSVHKGLMNLTLIFSKINEFEFKTKKMIGSNSTPASFFKSYVHSHIQYILFDIITQFMTLFKRKRLRRISNVKYRI